MNSAGTIRKYVLQTLKEVNHGFVNEVDLPTFYDNVDDIDVLFENDLTAKNELSGWIPFIDRLRVDALKYKGMALTDFLIDYLFAHLDGIKGRIEAQSEPFENDAPQLPEIRKRTSVATLSELICSDKSELIIEKIKVQYRNVAGKRLKLLFMALQELKLIPKERTASKFHSFCKNEFDWSIGSYQSMNDYDYNVRIDKDEFSEMKSYIENIIKNY